MYCPRCATEIADKQNYCRNCGLKLDVIVNAMEDRPHGPFDFESLKRDLRDLGSSLRAGFDDAHLAIKKTRKLSGPGAPQDQSREINKAVWSHEVSEVLKHEINKALKKVKATHSRKYSLQQATLSIFGGGAIMAVWYYLLEAATNSSLLNRLEWIIMEKTETPIHGLVPVFQLLWMIGLIPVARGVAHLINGIFFAPKIEKEKEPERQPDFGQNYIRPPQAYDPAAANPTTNELSTARNPQPPMSVVEDPTLQFDPK